MDVCGLYCGWYFFRFRSRTKWTEGCSAITLQANLTALAARRCVTPTHKLKLILSEQIASFLLGYFDVIVLLIYLRYILKLDFQGKIGPMLLISFFYQILHGIVHKS